MTEIVYLFDIDGTLLRAGGAGSRAFDRVMRELHEVEDASVGTAFGGKTDPWIIDQLYRRLLGRAASQEDVDTFIGRYLPYLEDELATRPLRVLPAVEDTLAALGQRAVLGVATGNVAAAADIKLRYAGLTGHFRFGGYGSDSWQRAELVAVAIERARAFAPPQAEVVVVGDTVHDIAAARACGVQVCAVATGPDPADALGEADAVFARLDELLPWHHARWP
jgi:phosphoglycolate phosphatase-like HAD superfamily hydrolase